MSKDLPHLESSENHGTASVVPMEKVNAPQHEVFPPSAKQTN